jgi:NAD(P)-dependent dehydrogenase (short-subunit alcohol dehydrogenase family)
MFGTNVNGYARCVRACLPYLKVTKGNILNTSSMVGMNGMADAFAYCSTKGAIIGMTKNLAIDLARYGIRVNAICPGWIVTEHLRNSWTKRQPNPDTALQELAEKHPLKRAGTPRDCGRAAVYLCSDDADFITGICFDIDGGIRLGYK